MTRQPLDATLAAPLLSRSDDLVGWSHRPLISNNRRRALVARVASVAALVLLAGPLSGAVHYATVTHVVCAEHGGTVHLDAHHPTAEASHGDHHHHADASEVADGVDRIAGQDAPADQPDSGEHSHCELLATLAQGVLLQAPTGLSPPELVAAPGAVPSLAPSAHVGAPRYHFAPKTSPPSEGAVRV